MLPSSTATQPRDISQDPSSTFYIHPNESPALVLVSPPLTGPNYHSWARAMRLALLSKNKLQFVDGSITAPPSSDLLHHAWERCNTMVLSWLTRSLSPSIAQSILWIDTASEVWADLKDRFSQGDVFHISDLQEEIQCCKQGDLPVSEYFTKLKILWNELANLRPLPSCHCTPSCSCGATATATLYHQQDHIIRFIKGLNDRFATVKTQIMLMDPLPPLNRVFSLVLQQEKELGDTTDHHLFFTKTTAKNFSPRNPTNSTTANTKFVPSAANHDTPLTLATRNMASPLASNFAIHLALLIPPPHLKPLLPTPPSLRLQHNLLSLRNNINNYFL